MSTLVRFLFIASAFSAARAVDCFANSGTSLHLCDRWIACRDSGGTQCDDGSGNLGTKLSMVYKGITGIIPPADLAQMTAITILCVRAAALRRPHASFATAAHAHLAPTRRHRAHSAPSFARSVHTRALRHVAQALVRQPAQRTDPDRNRPVHANH
jgi:hypothetical protein